MLLINLIEKDCSILKKFRESISLEGQFGRYLKKDWSWDHRAKNFFDESDMSNLHPLYL